MGATFSRVIYDPTQAEIAKVNRVTKTLYLNPDIWKGLPSDQKEFVLLHEKGHLELKTADEFEANKYAVSKFAPVRTLTNAQFSQRIIVMRDILTPRESGFVPAIIAGAVTGISNILPVLGIGSGARQKEAAANAAAQSTVIEAQSKADQKKNQTNIILGVLAGVFLIVIVTLYFTFKK